MQAFVHIAEIGKARQESEHEDKIISARVYIYDLLLGEPGMGRDKGYILAELAAVADGDIENSLLPARHLIERFYTLFELLYQSLAARLQGIVADEQGAECRNTFRHPTYRLTGQRVRQAADFFIYLGVYSPAEFNIDRRISGRKKQRFVHSFLPLFGYSPKKPLSMTFSNQVLQVSSSLSA